MCGHISEISFKTKPNFLLVNMANDQLESLQEIFALTWNSQSCEFLLK